MTVNGDEKVLVMSETELEDGVSIVSYEILLQKDLELLQTLIKREFTFEYTLGKSKYVITLDEDDFKVLGDGEVVDSFTKLFDKSWIGNERWSEVVFSEYDRIKYIGE